MNLTYHIQKKKPRENGEVPIMLAYRINGREAYISAKRNVLPIHWNKESADSPVRSSYGDGYITFNLFLKNFRNQHSKIADEFYIANARFPTVAEFKDLCSPKKTDKSFFGLYNRWVRFQSTERGKNNVTAGTHANYIKVKNRIEAYQTHIRKPFTFDCINKTFYDSFVRFCTDLNNSGATIGSYVKILKTFVKWANMHHSAGVSDATIDSLKVMGGENYFVFLFNSQFVTMRDLDLRHYPALDKCRDAAVVQTGLACRYSDMEILLSANVYRQNGKYYLQMTTKKNEKKINIPLSQAVVNVLEKYKGVNPKDWIPKSHHQNLLLKELGKQIGLYEKVVITKWIKGVRKEVVYAKWELVTTHTFRRTAINLMQKEGMRDIDICAITGQSLQTISTYKQNDENALERATAIWDRPSAQGDSPEPQESNS